MDPNEALKLLRELVDRIQNADPHTDTSLDADSLAETFQGLDVWLSRGGFPPSAWARRKMIVR